MKLCFIGKYPPIEGGVSTENYWAARGLAERGHEVHVVTNAFEVEKPYRMQFYADDQSWLEETFASGGTLAVHPTSTYDPRELTHIPGANPYVSKVAGIAKEVVDRYDCDLIFAFYFEPYGVAGHLVASWTGRPLAVQHAGSDLDRLMPNPYLAPTYQEVLRSADAIMTSGHHVRRFASFGVEPAAIFPRPGVAIQPRSVFKTEPEPDDADRVERRARRMDDPDGDATIDLSKPTIGIYGKVGVTKGSFDLVEAAGHLRNEGLDFNLLAMTQGRVMKRFVRAVHEHGVADVTWRMPFVANWRVPHFIRSCTAVCFLERDFPIAIHGPRIPREVFACGGCMILSREIASKQFYQDEFDEGNNVLIVEDPKQTERLADALRRVLRNTDEADRIGRNGEAIRDAFQTYEESIDRYEALFGRLLGRETDARSFQDVREDGDVGVSDDDTLSASFHSYLNPIIPWAELFKDDQFTVQTDEFRTAHPEASKVPDPLATLSFVRHLQARLRAGEISGTHPSAPSILRFQEARISIRWENGDADRGPSLIPTLDDVLAESRETKQDEAGERGRRVQYGGDGTAGRQLLFPPYPTRIVALEYDVIPLFSTVSVYEGEAGFEAFLDEHTTRQDLGVVLRRFPNGQVREHSLDPRTRDLLQMCIQHEEVDSVIQEARKENSLSSKDIVGGIEVLLNHDFLRVQSNSVNEGIVRVGKRSIK